MENKIHPLVVRNVQFKNILPLNENVIRKIRCTKRTSTDGKSDKFEITHLTGQGEIVLSTAEISTISREASDNSLRFSEACEFSFCGYNATYQNVFAIFSWICIGP